MLNKVDETPSALTSYYYNVFNVRVENTLQSRQYWKSALVFTGFQGRQSDYLYRKNTINDYDNNNFIAKTIV